MGIVRREVRAKELAIELAQGGGTTRRELFAEESMRPLLGDAEVRQLAELAVRIESHYGAPQDTEWAFDPDGKGWMLQSRPVTALGGATHQAASEAATEGAAALELVPGLGAALGSGSGPVRVITSLADASRLNDGDVW